MPIISSRSCLYIAHCVLKDVVQTQSEAQTQQINLRSHDLRKSQEVYPKYKCANVLQQLIVWLQLYLSAVDQKVAELSQRIKTKRTDAWKNTSKGESL